MINPDYVSYTLNLSDGRTATGVLRAEGADSVRLASSEAQETVIPVDIIDEMHPQLISMMPQGLLDKLSAPKRRTYWRIWSRHRRPLRRNPLSVLTPVLNWNLSWARLPRRPNRLNPSHSQ